MLKVLLASTALLLPISAQAGTKIIDTPEVVVPQEVVVQEVTETTAEVIAEVLPTISVPELTAALAELSTVEPGSPEAAEVVATVIETLAAAAETATSVPELTVAQAEVAVTILTTLISSAPSGSPARAKLEAIRARIQAQ